MSPTARRAAAHSSGCAPSTLGLVALASRAAVLIVVGSLLGCTINEPLVRVDRGRQWRGQRGYLVAHFHLDPSVNGQSKPFEWTDAVGVPYVDFRFRDPANRLRSGAIARSGYLLLEVIPGRYRFVGLKICLGILSCDQKIRFPSQKKKTNNPTLPTTELSIRAGELLYLGHLRMEHRRSPKAVGYYRFSIVDRVGAARRYIESRYPNLRGRFRGVRTRLLDLPAPSTRSAPR
ncbi:MAG: hypothetical protein KC609_17140 [Myxococcales bacterium]|nr:hypothetical protein [Myxococcales bacterium]